MKTTGELKRFFKGMGLKVNANTSRGKSQFQRVYLLCEPNKNWHAPLVYKSSFPEDLRRLCLRTVYPDAPTLHNQTSAGNIDAHSITMTGQQWEAVIAEWTKA